MKKIFFTALAVCFVGLTFSCSSDDNGSSTSPTITDVTNTMSSGTWRITKYIDSGDDETTDFNGYNFTFSPNTILMATNGTNEYMGSWIVATDNSNDDSPSNDLDFIISFSGPVKFIELSDDWDIQSRTSTKLELIDVSGGNGGTDYLTFEKN
ncbi:hypothetical protein [Flavobacterium sp.]|jgi:hypothetical protein|uniref:hypothetical protein n=1 Tax=Flavobacterium sp. TaxID=239 RepID=UPI0037BFBAFF